MMLRLHRIGLVSTCLAVAAVSMAIGGSARAATGLGGPSALAARTQTGALPPGYLLRLPAPEMPTSWCVAGTLSDSPVVGAVGLTDGAGGWEVAADGSVFACGAAGYYGSVPGLGLRLLLRIPGGPRQLLVPQAVLEQAPQHGDEDPERVVPGVAGHV